MSSALLSVAARIDDSAAQLRTRARRIRSHIDAARWSSPGARRYYARLGAVLADLSGCAADLDALADLFRREAARQGARPAAHPRPR